MRHLIPLAILTVVIVAGLIGLYERAERAIMHDADCDCDACREDRDNHPDL